MKVTKCNHVENGNDPKSDLLATDPLDRTVKIGQCPRREPKLIASNDDRKCGRHCDGAAVYREIGNVIAVGVETLGMEVVMVSARFANATHPCSRGPVRQIANARRRRV